MTERGQVGRESKKYSRLQVLRSIARGAMVIGGVGFIGGASVAVYGVGEEWAYDKKVNKLADKEFPKPTDEEIAESTRTIQNIKQVADGLIEQGKFEQVFRAVETNPRLKKAEEVEQRLRDRSEFIESVGLKPTTSSDGMLLTLGSMMALGASVIAYNELDSFIGDFQNSESEKPSEVESSAI